MLRGHVDTISPTIIAGWALDDSSPNEQIDVFVFVDGRRVALVSCNQPRDDLKALGFAGDVGHGFRYEFPSALVPNRPTRITVRFASNGRILGAGDAMLPPDTRNVPPDLNARPPDEYFALPAPTMPRHTLDLFALFDRRQGLYNLLSQIDFGNQTARQTDFAALGSPIPTLEPNPWDALHPRDRLYDLLMSDEFWTNLMPTLLNAFPEKKRLLFVHIPKCAGSDLSYNLAFRYPSFPYGLASPLPAAPHIVFESLASVVRSLPFSDKIFVRGHVNLGDYEKHQLVRPCDHVFTILRDPIEIAISGVNYVLTRLRVDAEAGSFKADSQSWLQVLRLPGNPGHIAGLSPASLGRQILREKKIVMPNSMCLWLGGGTVSDVMTRLATHSVEVTTTQRYNAWLKQHWSINSSSRQNESTKFLTRDSLSSEDLDYLVDISSEDDQLYRMVGERLDALDQSSLRMT